MGGVWRGGFRMLEGGIVKSRLHIVIEYGCTRAFGFGDASCLSVVAECLVHRALAPATKKRFGATPLSQNAAK